MQLWRGVADQTTRQHNPRGRQQLLNGIDCLPWGTHLLPQPYHGLRVYIWKIYKPLKQTPQCEAKSFSQKRPGRPFFWHRKKFFLANKLLTTMGGILSLLPSVSLVANNAR